MEAVPPPEEPTPVLDAPTAGRGRETFEGWSALSKLVFGTPQYFRLWLAQLVTSIGEWVFLFAVAIKAAQVGPGTPEGAVALVLLARMGPGFFLGQFAGVLADRWDRRKLMATCDLCRAAVVCAYPFVDHVWQLVLLNLLLEAFTLLWIPTKDALVPNLVPARHLPTANTLGVVATYGTIPIAIFLMWVFDTQSSGDGTTAGFFFDSGTFIVSALLIWSIMIPARRRSSETTTRSIDADKLDFRSIWTEMRAGWSLILGDVTLRAVNLGLAVGLIGGSMIAILGRVYVDEVLRSSDDTFVLLGGFGLGVIIGVLGLLVVSQRIDRPWVFGRSLLLAGIALMIATTVDQVGLVVVFLGFAGAMVGIVYILGFTILQEETDDDLRGRVFGAVHSVARLSVALILVLGPTITVLFDRITELTTDGSVSLLGYELLIPGVRITFWFAALIITGAGALAMRTLRDVGNTESVNKLRSVK